MLVKSNYSVFAIFICFFIYMFLVFDPNFNGPDEPIYFAYTASMFEEGDLNVVNQIPPHHSYYQKIGISKTYNLPDYHNHGGVILWLPFYAYGKFAYSMASGSRLREEHVDKFTHCAMSFSTVTFSCLMILFTYLLCRYFFSGVSSFLSCAAMFFGTPLFYFTLFHTGNAQIAAGLLSVISIWFCCYAIDTRKILHWFVYGVFFSICVVVKIDLWFQLLFIISFFAASALSGKIAWKNGLYFIMGLMPGLALKLINDYIKYGGFHQGEFNLLNFRSFYLFEQLFSSYRGFFYTSPVFYICMFGLWMVMMKLARNSESGYYCKRKDFVIFILAVYLLLKIFILSYRYAWGGGTPGARILLTELPVFALLFARFVEGRRRIFIGLVVIISIFFIAWNVMVVSEFIARVDIDNLMNHHPIAERVKVLKFATEPLFLIKDLEIKLRFFLPLFFIVVGIFFYVAGKLPGINQASFEHPISSRGGKMPSAFVWFTLYLSVAYGAITVLNVYNNKRNAKDLMGMGFFENSEVVEPAKFERVENEGSLNEIIAYYKLIGNYNMVHKLKRDRKEIFGY